MRGKPRGYYGPTGERNSGIRYVPTKEQKEMAEQWQIVKEQQSRIAALEAALHTRNGELLVARMELDMLRDDVRRATALLPQEPGAALGVLVQAIQAQNAPQGPCTGTSETIAPQTHSDTGWPGTPEERAP